MLSIAIAVIAFTIQNLIMTERYVGIDLMIIGPGLETTRDIIEIIWMILKLFELSEWRPIGCEVRFRLSLLFH